ncbi:hypothetical protein PXNS11_460002 [Stutzerimonas xanthomarina]|nr:hypothetical protein PXNS11_460002 [Stutzerimonas xanthomarina]
MQPLRQQAHLIGRLPLKLLFQQNQPIAASADGELPPRSPQGEVECVPSVDAGQLSCARWK